MITSIVLIVIVTILLLVSGRVGGGQVEVSGVSFTMERSYTDALRGLAMVFIMVQHAVGAYLLEPVRANELMYKSAHMVARVFMAVGIIGMAWRVRLLVRSRVLLFMAPFLMNFIWYI